jgi:hypothetical protein
MVRQKAHSMAIIEPVRVRSISSPDPVVDRPRSDEPCEQSVVSEATGWHQRGVQGVVNGAHSRASTTSI